MALNSNAMQPQLTLPYFSFTTPNCLIFCSTGKQPNKEKKERVEYENAAALHADTCKHMFNTDAHSSPNTERSENVIKPQAQCLVYSGAFLRFSWRDYLGGKKCMALFTQVNHINVRTIWHNLFLYYYQKSMTKLKQICDPPESKLKKYRLTLISFGCSKLLSVID